MFSMFKYKCCTKLSSFVQDIYFSIRYDAPRMRKAKDTSDSLRNPSTYFYVTYTDLLLRAEFVDLGIARTEYSYQHRVLCKYQYV